MPKAFIKQRGIVIFITLLIIVFLVMFGSFVLITATNQKERAAGGYLDNVAIEAANAGISYAQAKLNDSPIWGNQAVVTTNPAIVTTISDSSLKVNEHYDGGVLKYVEGRIDMGDKTAYFDIYFDKPSAALIQGFEFFGDGKPGGPVADLFPLSVNAGSGSTMQVYYNNRANSEDASLKSLFREIPGSTVYITARGSINGRTSSADFLGQFAGENVSDMALGSRKNTSITLGYSGLLKMGVADNDSTRDLGCIVASGASMAINKGAGSADYVTLHNAEKDGGKYSENISFLQNPSANKDSFKKTPDVDKSIAGINFDSIRPPVNFAYNIKAGTYVISKSTTAGATLPVIKYYPTDNIADIYPTTAGGTSKVAATTDPSITALLKSTATVKPLVWDQATCTLKMNKCIKVATPTGTTLKNLNILPEMPAFPSSTNIANLNRIRLRLGPTYKLAITSTAKDTYRVTLLNENTDGSIYIGGEVSADKPDQIIESGTKFRNAGVIAKGDVTFEPETQLASDPGGDVFVWAGGNVNINAIGLMPENLDTTKGMILSTSQKSALNTVISHLLTLSPSPVTLLDSSNISSLNIAPSGLTADQVLSLLKDMGFVANVNGAQKFVVQKETVLALKSAVDNGYYYPGQPSPRSGVFKGVVYTAKDFNVNSAYNAFIFEGAAFGAGSLTDNTVGNICVIADSLDLTYNKDYLAGLNLVSASSGGLRKIFSGTSK